jgi:hypothetical protein
MIKRGGRALPPPTDMSPPNFWALSFFSSSTVERSPTFFACQQASSASVAGYTTFPGRFAMPRIRLVAVAIVCARDAAARTAAMSRESVTRVTESRTGMRSGLKSSLRKSASTIPSIAAGAKPAQFSM